MSAAQWRKAMNSGAGRQAWRAAAAGSAGGNAVMRRAGGVSGVERAAGTSGRAGGAHHASTPGAGVLGAWRDAWARTGPRHWLVMLFVLLYPAVASPFFTFQIGAQALAIGTIALSLTLLGGSGGMVSLSQATVAGVAGYCVAIFGSSSVASISLGWPWWVAVVAAIAIATLFATFVGWLSVRTEGIYTIMITLAIGVAFHYLAQQNYTVFNGFSGFSGIRTPTVFGIDLGKPTAFYYLTLATALAAYGFVRYLLRAPFGVALQGVRDNPRRMNALGFAVNAHRIAAHAVAGLIAATGGVLLVWYKGQISAGSLGANNLIDILIVAVLGGMRHPIGAFIGAIVFVLLQNFAVDLVDRERFNLLIGGVFLAIVLFSPDGLLGLWARLKARFA
ncbi:MAG: branched-chain amino acid ABC transporter permease [Lautropia sp.]